MNRLKDSFASFCVAIGLSLTGSGRFAVAAEVNAVGYANLTYRTGYALLANPLSNQTNRVDEIFSVPLVDGTQLVKFDGSHWLTNEVVGGFWTTPEMTLSPGEAALLRNPMDSHTYTFVGSVLQGELKVFIPAGRSLRGSLVPQSGKLSQILQFPKVVGTKISTVDNATGQWVLRATCTDVGWEPEEPVLNVGEGFYVEAPHDFVWSRLFAGNGQLPTSSAIRIVAQPQSQQINPGDTLSLSVEAASTNTLFYQWQRNGNDLADATGPNLTIPNAGPQDVGSYWVVVWDLKSWVWSQIATVELAGLNSPRLTINQDSTARGIVLVPQGTAGRKSVIETSEDLIHWLEAGDLQPVNANSMMDQFSGRPARFYRLRLD